MTPKEKAEELFNRYWFLECNVDSYVTTDKEYSKECALIAVDEIMNTYQFSGGIDYDEKQFWQEVRNEIEKL